jgi:hypothetical protein
MKDMPLKPEIGGEKEDIMSGMPGDVANNDQINRVRALLVELEWTESDAWILVSELPETFQGTLMQETPTFASMPVDEAAKLIRELERILAEG